MGNVCLKPSVAERPERKVAQSADSMAWRTAEVKTSQPPALGLPATTQPRQQQPPPVPQDLTTSRDGVALMASSQNWNEWGANVAKIKEANGGKYPEWWYSHVIAAQVWSTCIREPMP